jgi:tagatose-1,6-bisphosphate aldolase
LKLESPLAAGSLPPRDGSAAAQAAKEFDAVGDICCERGIPWVLLSGEGASEKFERVLDFAYAAGATPPPLARRPSQQCLESARPGRNALELRLPVRLGRHEGRHAVQPLKSDHCLYFTSASFTIT